MTDKGFFQVWRRSLYEAAAVKCIFSLDGPQSLTDCCALHLCDSFKSRGQSTEPSFRVVVFYLSRLVFGVSRTTGQQTRIVLCWYLGHTKCYNKGCLGLPQQDHVTPSFKAFRSLWKKKTIYISINQGRAALFQDCRPHQNPFIVTCALTWTQTAALRCLRTSILGSKPRILITMYLIPFLFLFFSFSGFGLHASKGCALRFTLFRLKDCGFLQQRNIVPGEKKTTTT